MYSVRVEDLCLLFKHLKVCMSDFVRECAGVCVSVRVCVCVCVCVGHPITDNESYNLSPGCSLHVVCVCVCVCCIMCVNSRCLFIPFGGCLC